mmetsp:Transcript_22666/g.28032  ORF Transcript_22666/g.28032 Transcript_22666/m.28032 type:complete len:136 (+) Transcript_22666:157-564(+)
MVCVVLDDIVLCILATALVVIFSSGSTKSWHFLDDFFNNHEDVLGLVELNVVLIMMPNICVLFLKTFYGLRWIRRGYTRPAFQSYYMWSWSFYTSFVVQEIMIIIFSWNVFAYIIRYSQLIAVCMCFIVFLLMRM